METTFDVELEEKEIEQIKARPWLDWTVGDESYKLKLTASVISKLERTLNNSLLEAVIEKGIPEVGTVITIIQAAMQKYHHGMKSENVCAVYDEYIDSGKTQMDLLQEIIYPLMYDAGFFTAAQLRLMTNTISEVDSEL